MLEARFIGGWLVVAALSLAFQACAPITQDSAQRALAEGRLDDAAYDIQAALAHDPDNLTLKNLAAQIFTQRGVKYYQAGQMIAASEDFHRAIDYYPTYAPAYDYLGMLSFQQRKWEDAIKYGSMGAGYAGQPEPSYVKDARQNLRKIETGGFSQESGSKVGSAN
jgi:tetratricopeptide (TPR) repeat protein